MPILAMRINLTSVTASAQPHPLLGGDMAGYWNRWVSLAAGMQLMFVAGAVYGFGSIAADIKAALQCSEGSHASFEAILADSCFAAAKQLIGVCGNLGLWSG